LSVVTDSNWSALVEMLGQPDWAVDATYLTEAGRRAAEDVIEAELGRWFAEQDCDEVADQLVAAGIPAAALINGYMISPHPQIDAREFRRTLTHAVSGEKHYPGLPFKLSDEAANVYAWAAPTIGQHNEEVLQELGLTLAEIAELAEKQVIGTRPSFED
jgi:crotonobetainyl-CoA:carnitine CoA-transferase CaiB-like acyl-CoA transferase